MVMIKMSVEEEYWEKVKDHFLKMTDVQKQGESLKTKKKMFVMLSKGKFVLKLPKERVEELITSGIGLPYDAGTGKPLKEWVILPIDYRDNWIGYTLEAKKFAKNLAK
jgi:hypothetical protein